MLCAFVQDFVPALQIFVRGTYIPMARLVSGCLSSLCLDKVA